MPLPITGRLLSGPAFHLFLIAGMPAGFALWATHGQGALAALTGLAVSAAIGWRSLLAPLRLVLIDASGHPIPPRPGTPRAFRRLHRSLRAARNARAAERDAALARQAALADSERQYRLLADHATDAVLLLRPDGRCTYASPASSVVLGRSAAVLPGTEIGSLAHPHERHALTTALADLQRGIPTVTASFRTHRQGGNWAWVEARGQRLPGGTGFVLAIVDIHDRKTLEAALEAAHTRLLEAAEVDSLTGLCTAAQFASALERECRRATREQASLALLVFDVRDFGDFNQLYGHAAGDAALRRVAHTVAGSLRRPGDVAARTGGDIISVLLPATGTAGALAVSRLITAAVEGLGIEFANSPDGVLSVAVGVAAMVPPANPADAVAALGRTAVERLAHSKGATPLLLQEDQRRSASAIACQ